MRKDFNSQRTGLGHQHGRRFIVLGRQNYSTFPSLYYIPEEKWGLLVVYTTWSWWVTLLSGETFLRTVKLKL